MSGPLRRDASLADFWSIPEGERFHELIAGELVQKATPSGEHGDAQVGVVSAIAPAFRRKAGQGFDLHGRIAVCAHRRERLEELVRYCARPAFANDRLTRRTTDTTSCATETAGG